MPTTGEKMTATNQDETSAIPTTWKSEIVY